MDSEIYHMLMNDKAKYDSLRRKINESLWTGAHMEALGLTSLKDILQYENDEGTQEQYVMLSTILGEKDERDPYSRDRHLIVNRTAIEFNKKSCRLISFTDISFKQRFQLSQSSNYQIARELTATHNLVVGALEESRSTIDHLFEQVDSASLRE